MGSLKRSGPWNQRYARHAEAGHSRGGKVPSERLGSQVAYTVGALVLGLTLLIGV